MGSFADVVVFDPKAEWIYKARDTKSKSRNTPFDGWTMQGKSAGRSAKDASRIAARLDALFISGYYCFTRI